MAATRSPVATDVAGDVSASVLGGAEEVRELDGAGTADALVRAQEALVAAELAQVALVAHWADLHAAESNTTGPDTARVLDGMERDVRLGGDGTPPVREFAATELGVLLGTTTHGARALMRDVLDLRHRHPLLWAAVQEGRARFWQARQITRAAHHAGLDLAGARYVDLRTAPHLGTVPWGRMLGLVEAAVIEADPERAEQRRVQAAMERFVRAGQSNEHGYKTLYARVQAGDAIGFLAMCDRIAQILAAEGDDEPVDVLRAKAIGWLGTPLRAAALLAGAERAVLEDTRGSEQGPAPLGRELLPVREHDLHPADNDADEPVPATTGPALVIDPTVDPDVFLPTATLFVHLSLDQLRRDTRGAARVEGVGPVTVEQAVDLLLHSRVRLTPVIDLNETWAVDSYQTPTRMREHLALRYPVEVFPHGTLAGRSADLDHVHPYRAGAPPGMRDAPGQTSTINLAPLARGHHRVKTHGRGWVHRQPVPGVHYWRTPHGHWARVDHRGTRRLGRHLTASHRALLEEEVGGFERGFAEVIAAA